MSPSQNDDSSITILSMLSSQKQFYPSFFFLMFLYFQVLFYQKQVISKQKVQPSSFESVEIVYFGFSGVVPPSPPCAFQMKLFVRHRLNL